MAADPKTSAGARTERRSFRDYLRRRLKVNPNSLVLSMALKFVMDRQARYDRKPKGLGK